ncbi:MAG: hypothetical protein DME49_03050 [Verrucomicrobia bacterium]|nr:MAG: hypothetical protein DME49_03050 [Verrucomicrobiota bacterium]PYK94448.1 MAG: hypothetical protein DME36_05875 [Verrucomicrobiota bacterium]
MKTIKQMIAFISLVVFCASAVWVEYKLVLQFGILFSLFASTSVSVGLFLALRAKRARLTESQRRRFPRKFVDDNKLKELVRLFWQVRLSSPGTPRTDELSHARHARLSQLTRAMKMDMARLFSNP